MQPNRVELVNKYFIPTPPDPVSEYVKLGIGGGLLLIGLVVGCGVGGASGACLGVLPGLIGVGLLISGIIGYLNYRGKLAAATPKATDAQMEAWLVEAVQPIVKAGYTRLNVHPTELGSGSRAQYLVFRGIPDFGEVPYASARGRDRVMRFSAYKFVMVYLSDWRLPVYECILDVATGTTFVDSTKEYALNQVDGMETVSDRINVFNSAAGAPMHAPPPTTVMGHVTRVQIVRLVVSGRPVIRLLTGIAAGDAVQIEGVSMSPIDGMISQLREHLRARTGAAAHPGAPGLGGAVPQQLGLPAATDPAAQFRLPPGPPPQGR